MIRAKGEVRRQREAKRLHRKMCRTCSELRPLRRRYCDEGWQIEQAIRAAAAEVARLGADVGAQGTLF